MAEGERSQERPQRRGREGVLENPAHPAVAEQGHVIDAVRTRDHPGHQRTDLQARVRALVGRDAQVLAAQHSQTCRITQSEHGNQPGRRHQIRVIEDHRRRARRVREFHPRDALPGCGVGTVASPNLPAQKGILLSRHAQPSTLIGGSRLRADPPNGLDPSDGSAHPFGRVAGRREVIGAHASEGRQEARGHPNAGGSNRRRDAASVIKLQEAHCRHRSCPSTTAPPRLRTALTGNRLSQTSPLDEA